MNNGLPNHDSLMQMGPGGRIFVEEISSDGEKCGKEKSRQKNPYGCDSGHEDGTDLMISRKMSGISWKR